MTNREFYSAIINGTVGTAEIDFAKEEIAKLDARNERRRNTPTKEQVANENIKNAIVEALADKPLVASEIATACGISTQKASALCAQLVAVGKIKVADLKIKGKGTVKQYTVVAE